MRRSRLSMGVMLLLVAAVRSSAGAQIAPSPAWARVDSVTPATAPTNYKNASVTVSWAPVIDGATGKPWAGYVLKVLACPGWSGVVITTTTVTLTGCTCGNGGDPHVQSAASGRGGASKPVYFVTRTNGSHNLFIPCNEKHQDPWAKFPPILSPMNEATREGPDFAQVMVAMDLEVLQRDNTWKKVAPGDRLKQNDTIRTLGNGSAKLLLPDNTELGFGADSQLRLDEVGYDPSTSQGNSLFSFLKGSFIYVSGLLVKERRIEMPSVEIGIRGTEFIGRYDPGAQRQEIYLINGELVVTPSSTGVATHVTAPTSVVSDGAYVRTSPLSQTMYDLLKSEILRTGTPTPTPAVGNLED